MGWRTIVISQVCKLSYKNDYLLIRNEDLKMIHLSEINMIVIENGMVSITSYLISELMKQKISLIFCDEKHNPSCELLAYYGAYNTSKKVQYQAKWQEEQKQIAWKEIVKLKIFNQARLLKKLEISGYDKILEYINEVENDDRTNREGHAAKVYFNSLFGKEFTRDSDSNINKALDYGYSLLLSSFNREIVSKGYITQLGIKHKNEFNQFNLSCDLMEVFRPLVDEIVFSNKQSDFNTEFKIKLLNVFNLPIIIKNREQFLNNAISIFCNDFFNYMEDENLGKIINYEF